MHMKPDFHYDIRNMDYETNVTVSIIAFNMGNTLSRKICSLSFTTLSCQQLRNKDARVGCGKTIFFVF